MKPEIERMWHIVDEPSLHEIQIRTIPDELTTQFGLLVLALRYNRTGAKRGASPRWYKDPDLVEKLRHIVDTHNSHAALVEALESCRTYFDDRYDGSPDGGCGAMVEPMEKIEKALAIAKGGK